MTERTIIKKQPPSSEPKHFEDLWEAAEQLFDKNKLNVDSVLNELQAKISLYRVLGSGSFDTEQLNQTKTALFGKILVALTKLSLIENVNTYLALSGGIEEQKLMALESTISPSNQGTGMLDKISEEFRTRANKPDALIGENQHLMKDLQKAITDLAKVAPIE